ncbi:1,4-alpha-glucan branching enzyme, partial [Streptacidiphilus sp. MAP12-16]|uniref:alpha amylase C-terminal domain-containing protein n=1 Tax=Streptacidiphilus sp. MAP12-16 TaxID=3156300 RepID=UPI0035138A41
KDLVRDLNRLYVDSPALWQLDTEPAGFAWIDGGAAEDNVFSFVRYDREGRPLVAISNLSPVVRHDYRVGLPTVRADVRDARWLEILNTDAEVYGGSGVGNPDPVKADATPWNGRDTSAELILPPLATIWLTPA